MSINEAHKKLLFQLYELYNNREAANISDLIIENITGFSKIDRIINKQFLLNTAQEKLLENYTQQLLQQKPVQYILHEAWFAGMKFYVDENVLIPRPETEELVDWIEQEIGNKRNQKFQLTINNNQLTILDVGTGNGCIAIALKKKLNADVCAIDISDKALIVAEGNAKNLQSKVQFKQINILNKNDWKKLALFDVIVSNPPYVKKSEQITMQKNVINYEPHEALFVNDEDALIFYKTIAEFGLQHLNKNGKLFFEINEVFGKNVCLLLKKLGYKNIELKKDLNGKDRMVKAGCELMNL
ncbi:MAG: peptide chain release factor N(5)-glutamine methyltransferase [Chitinophagaceae bacterium]